MWHTTRDGKCIKICDLETSHIKNIINFINKKASEGIEIKYGFSNPIYDPYFDTDEIYGNEVRSLFNYDLYKKELKRRFVK